MNEQEVNKQKERISKYNLLTDNLSQLQLFYAVCKDRSGLKAKSFGNKEAYISLSFNPILYKGVMEATTAQIRQIEKEIEEL